MRDWWEGKALFVNAGLDCQPRLLGLGQEKNNMKFRIVFNAHLQRYWLD